MSSHVMQPDASSLPPRSDGLLREPAFPILTLDESRLTPALGYVFRKGWLYPHESLISICGSSRLPTRFRESSSHDSWVWKSILIRALLRVEGWSMSCGCGRVSVCLLKRCGPL